MSISLTSYVELFFIESICSTERNQIDMFEFSDKMLRELVCSKSKSPSNYTPYIATILLVDSHVTVRLESILYTDPILLNTTYFLINKTVNCSNNDRFYMLYTQSGGWNKMGSESFPSTEYRYRLAMPSRGITFR